MDAAKDQVKQILEALPEDASLEDIQYHAFVHTARDLASMIEVPAK